MRPNNIYRLDDNDLSPSSNIDEICKQIVERLSESEQRLLRPLIKQLLQLIERHDAENGRYRAKKLPDCISILDDAVDNLDNSSSGMAIQLIDALSSEVACDEFLLITLYECDGDLDKFVSWFARSQVHYEFSMQRYNTVESRLAFNLIHELKRACRKTQEQHSRVLFRMMDVFFILLTSDLRRRLGQSDISQRGYLSIEFLIEVGCHPVFEKVIQELTKRVDQTQKYINGPNVNALQIEIIRLIDAADSADWRAKSLNVPTTEPGHTHRTWGEHFQAIEDIRYDNIESTKCTVDALQLATTKTYRFDDYQRALTKVLVVHHASIVDDSLLSLARSEAQTSDVYGLSCGRLGILGSVLDIDVLKKALEGKHSPKNKKTIVLPKSTSGTLYFDNLITHVIDSLFDSGEKFKALWFLRQLKLSLKRPMKDINDIFNGKDKICLHSLFSGVELSQEDWVNSFTLVSDNILNAIDRWDTSINSLIAAIIEDMPLADGPDATLFKRVILDAFDKNSFPHILRSVSNADEPDEVHQEMDILRALNRFSDCINDTLHSFTSEKNSILGMQCFVNRNIEENHPLIRLLRALSEHVYPDDPHRVIQAAQPWCGLIDDQIPYILSSYDSHKHPIVERLLQAKPGAAW